MNEPQMTKEQEALLDEALKYSQIASEQAKQLWEKGEAFAQKWEKWLSEAEKAVVPNPDN